MEGNLAQEAILAEAYLSIDSKIAQALECYHRSQHAEAISFCEQALEIAQQAELDAEVFYAEGLRSFYTFDFSAAETSVANAIQADIASGNKYRLAIHLIGMSRIQSRRGDKVSIALDNLDQAISVLKDIEFKGFEPETTLAILPHWVYYFLWLAHHSKGYIFDAQYRHGAALLSYWDADECSREAVERGAVQYRCFTMTPNNRGVLLAGLGQLYNALKEFEKAKAGDSDNSTYYNNIGFLYFQMHEDNKALEYLEEGLQIAKRENANCSYLYYNLGLWYLRKANISQEVEDKNASLEQARKYFRSAYEDHSIEQDLLRAISADCMIKRLEDRILNPEKHAGLISAEDRERIVASDILEEFLGDLNNFITESAQRLDAYNSFLNKPRTITEQDCKLIVLRRWNSFTPGLPLLTNGASKGGGYFICWKGKGIVIDPGFDFVENFAEAGLSLEDIDAILITQAHIDHTNDLETLIMLLAERNAQNPSPRQVTLGLNLGCLNKVNVGWILREASIISQAYSLTFNQSITLSEDVQIKVLRAKHADAASEETAVGLDMILRGEGRLSHVVFSGDTAWESSISCQYKGGDVIVLHLGTVTFKELFALAGYTLTPDAVQDVVINPAFDLMRFDRHIKHAMGYKDLADFTERVTSAAFQRQALRKKNHLCFIGIYDTILSLTPPPKLIILSEFGEELGVNRYKIAKVLNSHFERGTFGLKFKDVRCLTGDINLQICLSGIYPAIRCDICGRFIDYRNIMEDCSTRENLAVKHYCKEHRWPDGKSPFLRWSP